MRAKSGFIKSAKSMISFYLNSPTQPIYVLSFIICHNLLLVQQLPAGNKLPRVLNYLLTMAEPLSWKALNAGNLSHAKMLTAQVNKQGSTDDLFSRFV